jgi:iron(III) transport system ATP-binding protein
VLPGRVLAPPEAGRCAVLLLGTTARLRAAARQASGPAAICLRSEDLRLREPGPDAVAAVVRRAIYEGGRTAIELEPVGAPAGTRLTVVVPGDAGPPPGQTLHLAIDDGWVLPDAAGA